MTEVMHDTKPGYPPMTCTEHLERVAMMTDQACYCIETRYADDKKITDGLWQACRYLKTCVAKANGDVCHDCVRAFLGAIDMCAWAEGISYKARAHIIGSTAMRVGSDYRVAVVPGVLRDEQVK